VGESRAWPVQSLEGRRAMTRAPHGDRVAGDSAVAGEGSGL